MLESEQLVNLQREIYRKAKRANAMRLDDLMSYLVDDRNLAAAWRRVASADGAATPGPDGLVALNLDGQHDSWLEKLGRQLRTGSYTPSVPRWIEVAKSGQPYATRRLGIMNIDDRLVHTALKQILEPILDPTFAPNQLRISAWPLRRRRIGRSHFAFERDRPNSATDWLLGQAGRGRLF